MKTESLTPSTGVTPASVATLNADTPLAAWNGRPTVALVDLDVLALNIRHLRGLIGPDVRLMAVVKANGYGHGAVTIARYAVTHGVDALAVATVDEGEQLRRAGIEMEILVLGPVGDAERQRAVRLRLALVVGSVAFARALAADVRRAGTEPAAVHIKIDTGMHRFGCTPDDAVAVAHAVDDLPELRWAGLVTHLATADDPDTAFTRIQMARFDGVVGAIREAGLEVPNQHVSNSAATLRFPELHRDQVRVGIALYGLRPDPAMALPPPMRPILTVHGRIGRVIPLQRGDTVSYGRTYRAERDEIAALVPVGYADGYPRALSSRAEMSIAGQPAPILGRVCMDQTVVRVPVDAMAQSGDPVVVVGDGTDETAGAPMLDELAALAGTNGYELATGLAARLPKLYLAAGEIVAIEDLLGRRRNEP